MRDQHAPVTPNSQLHHATKPNITSNSNPLVNNASQLSNPPKKTESRKSAAQLWIVQYHDVWSRLTLSSFFQDLSSLSSSQFIRWLLDRANISMAVLKAATRVSLTLTKKTGFDKFPLLTTAEENTHFLVECTAIHGFDITKFRHSHTAKRLIDLMEASTAADASPIVAITAIWGYMLSSWQAWALCRRREHEIPQHFVKIAEYLSREDSIRTLMDTRQLLDHLLTVETASPDLEKAGNVKDSEFLNKWALVRKFHVHQPTSQTESLNAICCTHQVEQLSVGNKKYLHCHVYVPQTAGVCSSQGFEEAYNKTRRILNITVCPSRSSSDPSLLLNYLTAPHVLIWSAASASCALPYVFAPVELVTKSASGRLVPYHPDGVRWIDGSISSDVPLSRIGELFNVNHFIVSQTNPHVIPRSMPIMNTRVALLIKSELQFRYWQALQMGLIPKLLTSIFPHFMQPYAGDVTIMPDVRFSDLTKLLTNPTPESLQGFIRRGEMQTFPFLDRIRLHCLIEQTLERSVEYVATAAKGDERQDSRSSSSSRKGGPVLFGRVPSWLWLDTRSILNSGAMSAVASRFGRRGDEDGWAEPGDESEEKGGERNEEDIVSVKSTRLEGNLRLKEVAAMDEILDGVLLELAGETLEGEQILDPAEYRFHGLSDNSEDSTEDERPLC